MAEKKELELKLMTANEEEEPTPANQDNPVIWNDFEYKEFGNAPKIKLTGLFLIIACPVLISLHFKVAQAIQIHIVQFIFVSGLVAFLINYLGIIRRFELMPFLPQSIFDAKLKRICVLSVIALVLAIFAGWNGSGGIIFAMIWESARGNRMGFYGYMLAIIIAGSLLMQKNYTYTKLFELLPGIILGYVNSVIFTLQESSFYPIGHQFMLLMTIVVPMMFPICPIVTPSILQWLVMIICGATFLITILFLIKLMQNERVSVVMGILSGLLMIGTSKFDASHEYIGAVVILVGVVLLIKKQYIDLQY